MKKLLFGTIVTMFTLSALTSNAQMKQGAYVGVNIGYSAAAGVANFGGLQNETQISTTSFTVENFKFSLGKGVNAGINLGYMFNENIGFELGAQYLIGGKTTASEKQLNGNYQTTAFSSKMIQLKPTIVLATSMKNITPYAKFGMVIGSGKVLINREEKSGSDLDVENFEFSKGMSIGFNAAIGVSFPINNNLSFSADINTINMQYSPKKGTMIKYTENGIDKLASRSVRDKEIEFVKTKTYNSLTPSSSTLPTQTESVSLPFGSIGINIGVKYSF